MRQQNHNKRDIKSFLSDQAFTWPLSIKSNLGSSTFQGSHNLHLGDQFSDKKIAELLDVYPRHKLGVYRFPTYKNSSQKAEHGCAPDLTGHEILDAVKTGQIWLNLRAVNRELPEYEVLSKTIFEQLKAASTVSTLKEDVGVLISSPNIHVHYHLDIPLVCLVQLRGEKEIYIYPASAPYVNRDEISALVLNRKDEQMRYESAFDDAATRIKMTPGMAVTWPQTAPHRVQNSNTLNISLSCEFMTKAAIFKANALHTNAVLRSRGLNMAAFPKKLNALTLSKAIAARVLKIISPVPVNDPVPISFELLKNGDIKSHRNDSSALISMTAS